MWNWSKLTSQPNPSTTDRFRLEAPSVANIGLTDKEIHEARQIRDAETKVKGWIYQIGAVAARLVCGECGSREVRLGPAFGD